MTRPVIRSAWLTALALAWPSLPYPAAAQVLTLGAAVDSALASHPSLGAARASVASARASGSLARAARLPSLMASGSFSRFQEPMVVAPLHGFDPASPPSFDRTLVQSQIGVDYTLFDGGARGARIRVADEMEGSLHQLGVASEMALLESVTSAYLGVLASGAVLEAADRQVASLESELDRARQRLQEGTTPRVEVLRAEAALLDAEAQRATARATVGLAQRGLARLMGVGPDAVAGLRDVAVPQASARPEGASDPREDAAHRRVAAARARVDQEEASRLPTVRASAGLQHFGTSSGDFVGEWQAGLRMSWPIFTGGARAAAIRRAEADLRAAQEDLRATELAVASERDAVEAARVEASGRMRALDAAVTQWEEVARIEVLALEAGAGVQQDFLRAEAALFRARAGLARARYDLILAHVAEARVRGHLDRAWMDDVLEIR